jgi:hypothetical protein
MKKQLLELQKIVIDALKDVTTFKDLYQKTEDMDKPVRDLLFKVVTYYLFKLSPELNNGLQNIWMCGELSDQFIKDHNLAGEDIDLVAQIDGQYYPVQCRFKQNPDVWVHFSELTTYDSTSMNNTKRIFLVTNSNNVSDEIEALDNVWLIYGCDFEDMPDNFFVNIVSDLKKDFKALEERELTIWCRNMKLAKKNGTLTADQIQKLEALPNWTWD